ncbi:type I deoxyribonuclease HsdR [Candidatus Methylomirabilis lanthanidiphila]|uniref:Type I restriction enzyme endonuclease subunit n=1 Tax=Candidatus Methylomirabilis lanthanidiphila TaxID=2211376 RepID=A0A564ZEX9_9BACT|nr:type I restriction endonuclease subunit R [Candidatus Methylomirabilis lanthanidiphila]VUZ83889.1 type I deoxyribonuclease HsdR [Candidatus Methylomirabilis lanthanidiphila]
MTFTESNTVEAYIRDRLAGPVRSTRADVVREPGAAYGTSGIGWRYAPPADVPRQPQDVLVESWLREALIRLNPEIAALPDRADDVLYKLRAIIMGVRSDGLVKANEEFAAWLTGERSMPFGRNGEHVTIRLLDHVNPARNECVVTTQYTFRAGATEKRADLVLLVNGIPLVVIEAKTPVRASQSWLDGAIQIHDDYERNVSELFVPNLLSVATDGKEFRYGSIGLSVELWGPWRIESDVVTPALQAVAKGVDSLLRPHVLLDLLSNFTCYATDKKKRRIKIVARYQQYDGVNKIVERVVAGHPKKGLIWHFQGSGKSLLMLFAARKLRLHPALKNPTVIIVVDRIDLDTQISSTFYAADTPNLVKAESRAELQRLLGQDVRKIIITTIFKFGEADGVLNDRSNIIAMVDEAHRTQEGDLGRKMREALPNAFLFGLTGTPINRADRNTFYAFGADEDQAGYMSRYGFEESIRDGATKPLHFEPRLLELHIDKDAIDQAFKELTGGLSDLDRDQLAKTAAKMVVLVKSPERIQKICADIARHFQDKVAPGGFGAQVVTFDRESCVLYKKALDEYLSPEMSDIVMTVNSGESEYAPYNRDRDAEEKLLDRFRDPADPLKILIVTSKLLTGFDAPILQAMYLDKPLRDHTLLQAICRTNRPYGESKTHGLIVDYLGVFDDVAQAIQFDEGGITRVVANINELKAKLPEAMQKCLAYFAGVDRTVTGYEGLIAAQNCLPNNDTRDRFAADYSYLSRLWEAISPDPVLSPYESDYRWLSQVYDSVKPSSGSGRLLWHALGAKTIELIHQHVHIDTIRDDLETLVLDADLLEAVLGVPDPNKKAKEIEIKVSRWLHKRLHDPRFKALGERLEDLKERHERGLLTSVEFLKELLNLARDVVTAERAQPPVEREAQGKAALTALFEEARNPETPIIVERVVNDIDEIVRYVRFDGWQNTHAGEREVKLALRKTLFKYRLHQDQELFDRAYGYIRQYY